MNFIAVGNTKKCNEYFQVHALSAGTSVLFRIHLQSSLCTHWVAKDPRFLYADSED